MTRAVQPEYLMWPSLQVLGELHRGEQVAWGEHFRYPCMRLIVEPPRY